jgi:hypothetical protein
VRAVGRGCRLRSTRQYLDHVRNGSGARPVLGTIPCNLRGTSLFATSTFKQMLELGKAAAITEVEPAPPRQPAGAPVVRDGQWGFLECGPAWEGNWTWGGFISFAWRGAEDQLTFVTVNYAANQGQCYVRLPFGELGGSSVRLRDQTSDAVYERSGHELLARGLYLDLPVWGFHVFDVSRRL